MKPATWLFLALTALLALSLALSQDAHATTKDDVFLAVLEAQGISNVNGDAGLIAAAHEICDLRAAGYTEMEVVHKVYLWSELDMYNAGFVVGAAEQTYCVWAA